MNFSSALLASFLAQGAVAFVPSPSLHQTKPSTALQAEKHNTIAVAASACLVGLGLSAQAAFADDNMMAVPQHEMLSTAISSSTIVADIEAFTLPSYDSSKGSTLIDLNGEVEKVNKNTMANAKAKREYVDKSAEKLEADELRRAEKEGGSLLDSMVGQSDKDQKDRVAAEIAESRANRWKTF